MDIYLVFLCVGIAILSSFIIFISLERVHLILYQGLFIIGLIGMLSIALIASGTQNNILENDITDTELIEQAEKDISFEDSVYNYIVFLEIKHPDIVMRQARIESGNFKSKIFKENNNMFGFKKAYKRPNTQCGINCGYACYSNWKQCIIDYALYQTYSAKNMSKKDYINFLDKNYAEDPKYKNKLE